MTTITDVNEILCYCGKMPGYSQGSIHCVTNTCNFRLTSFLASNSLNRMATYYNNAYVLLIDTSVNPCVGLVPYDENDVAIQWCVDQKQDDKTEKIWERLCVLVHQFEIKGVTRLNITIKTVCYFDSTNYTLFHVFNSNDDEIKN